MPAQIIISLSDQERIELEKARIQSNDADASDGKGEIYTDGG